MEHNEIPSSDAAAGAEMECLKSDIQTLPFDEFKRKIKYHKDHFEFVKAREILTLRLSREEDVRNKVWLRQQHALCTYKDEDMLPAKRFSDALRQLAAIGLLFPDKAEKDAIQEVPKDVPKDIPKDIRKKIQKEISETLSLGGAVYKRLFEFNGQIENLHNALSFYRAAWKRNPTRENAYPGLNAAFILDMLSSRLGRLEALTGTKSEEAQNFKKQAKELRQEIKKLFDPEDEDPGVKEMAKKVLHSFKGLFRHAAVGEEKAINPEEEYWDATTAAEVHFGLGEYKEAERLLAIARDLKVGEWMKQTTFRQLVTLARLQGYMPPPENLPQKEWGGPWQALAAFLGPDCCQAFSCWRGKVGLALSGGGFRASLFHLGVLARLAEMDVLRGVDVLSTVSGGSIVGAHYYLEVQNLLKKKEDGEVTLVDYIEIVHRVMEQFLAGVQRNLRCRALTNLASNFRLLFFPGYTRSHRMGDLYERELYSRVNDEHDPDDTRTMHGLFIKPAGDPDKAAFRPKFHNWRRRAKVPTLIINTACLNSGHSWHFTGSWMGEPPGLVGEDVSATARNRRLYYEDAPRKAQKEYRLGHAVAASACVPGLFEPLVIRGLYPGRVIRLVDGGVFDNQGVQGLLDESCTFILCSDASGQMDDQPSPPAGILGVTMRANSILQERVRQAEYQDLKARVENRALDGFFFIHLKQDLKPAALPWIKCKDEKREPTQDTTTPYGIDRDLQEKLAAIRTDLDSFTEVEAFSLMLSGYRMAKHKFEELNEQYHREGGEGNWGDFKIDAPSGRWPFLVLDTIMSKAGNSADMRRKDLEKQLDVAHNRAFKMWKLMSPLAKGLCVGLIIPAVAAAGWLLKVQVNWDYPIPLWSLVAAVALFLVSLRVPAWKWFNPESAVKSYFLKAILLAVGWVIMHVHIHLFDWMFLRRGSIDRLMKLPSED